VLSGARWCLLLKSSIPLLAIARTGLGVGIIVHLAFRVPSLFWGQPGRECSDLRHGSCTASLCGVMNLSNLLRGGEPLVDRDHHELARAFRMTYCHPECCTCGDNNRLLWLDIAWEEQHGLLLEWANGCEPADLYAWAQREVWESPAVAQALHDQGLKRYRRYRAAAGVCSK
jgi:hypothetical protein